MGKFISNYNELPVPNKRIYDLVQSKSDGTVKAFAEMIGVKQQVLDRIFKKDPRNGKYPSVSDKIKEGLKNTFGLDDVWLLTGEGDMLIHDSIEKKEILTSSEPISTGANYKLVPVIHVDSVGGIHSHNEISSYEPHYIEGYVPFVNAQDGDKAIFQTGNSMIPTCPPGSLLQVREVPNWREYFGYGNIFVIELKDGRRITKEVNRYDENPKEYVWCKSHNPDVADEELPKSMIVSVWKVVKILTDKGW